MKKEQIDVVSDICVITLTAALLGKLFFKTVFSVLLPFGGAFVIACIIHKPSIYISKKTKIPVGIVSAVMIVSFVLLLCTVICVGANKLLSEAGELLSDFVSRSEGNGLLSFFNRFKNITSSVSAFDALRENEELAEVCRNIDEFVHSALKNMLEEIKNQIGKFAASAIKALPEIFLYILVTIVASIFISSRLDRTSRLLIGLVPEKYRDRAVLVKKNMFCALKAYFKAYSVIYLITFAELFLGLSLMRKSNSLVLALLIAAVDILPIFGVGTVLIPWAVFELGAGSRAMALALIVLYVIIAAVREFAEPKIIGKSIGLSPLVTLLVMFAGYKAFGVAGMILAPIAAVAVFGGIKTEKSSAPDP